MRSIESAADYQQALTILRRLIRSPEGSREDEEGARLLTLIEKWEAASLGEPMKRVFSRDGRSFVTTVERRPWA